MANDTPEKKLKIRQSLKRRLWAAMVAEHAFKNARTTAQSYLDNGLHIDHNLHYTYVSSIVITYSKVFTGSNVVPTLSKEFSKFDEEEMDLQHEVLLLARNNIYAHADSSFLRYKLEAEVWMQTPTRTGMVLHLNSPTLNAGNIPLVVRLLEFQLVRLIPYRENLAIELMPGQLVYDLLSAERVQRTRVNIKFPSVKDTPGTW